MQISSGENSGGDHIATLSTPAGSAPACIWISNLFCTFDHSAATFCALFESISLD